MVEITGKQPIAGGFANRILFPILIWGYLVSTQFRILDGFTFLYLVSISLMSVINYDIFVSMKLEGTFLCVSFFCTSLRLSGNGEIYCEYLIVDDFDLDFEFWVNVDEFKLFVSEIIKSLLQYYKKSHRTPKIWDCPIRII